MGSVSLCLLRQEFNHGSLDMRAPHPPENAAPRGDLACQRTRSVPLRVALA